MATLLVLVVAVVLVVRPSSAPRIVVLPEISSEAFGLAFRIPTLPLAEISIELVGAPGRMRNGRREQLVTSRTKKFASLPATSQVCAVKPPLLFCSRRIAGVSVVLAWTSSTGVAVLSPTLLLLPTRSELALAPAVTAN